MSYCKSVPSSILKFQVAISVAALLLVSSNALADRGATTRGMSPESYERPELRDYRANNEREASSQMTATQELIGYNVAAYINQVIKPKIDFLMERNKAQEHEIRYLKLKLAEQDNQLAELVGRTAN